MYSYHAQVLPKVKAYHDSIGVPFGHWQFDSWFYPKAVSRYLLAHSTSLLYSLLYSTRYFTLLTSLLYSLLLLP